MDKEPEETMSGFYGASSINAYSVSISARYPANPSWAQVREVLRAAYTVAAAEVAARSNEAVKEDDQR